MFFFFFSLDINYTKVFSVEASSDTIQKSMHRIQQYLTINRLKYKETGLTRKKSYNKVIEFFNKTIKRQ